MKSSAKKRLGTDLKINNMKHIKNKACVVGHFGEGQNLLNGQTIKTKILTAELVKRYGEKSINIIDTSKGVRGLLPMLFSLARSFKTFEHIIIMPAHNGLKVIAPACAFFKSFSKAKVHYVVIGGWLHDVLSTKESLKKSIAKLDYVYAETTIMKKRLESLGLNNIVLMQNFKPLEVVSKDELSSEPIYPLKLCTLSRVDEKKGIEDAVNAVKSVNSKKGYPVFTLDIYGQIEKGQEQWFDSLSKQFTNEIKYMGSVDFKLTSQVLKEYFMLLFPTKYYTEGVPGTIIDAYSAGVPVLASKWESFSDVIDDNRTGIGYEFGSTEALLTLLEEISCNPRQIIEMQDNCLKKAQCFMPDSAMKALVNNL